MPTRTTPFHRRLSELDTQHRYTHWQGFLSPLRYSHAPKHEYFAVRNAVGVLDTSPLFKYRLTGPDAEQLLAGALVRDVRRLRPGRAHYTAWCDDRGFVMEDGVLFRHAADDFLLTAARPGLGWFADLGRRTRVVVEDVSDAYGVLAVQGPRSRAVLASLAPEIEAMRPFEHIAAKVGAVAVTVSRTGYTGDLGFEVSVAADRAVELLDAVLEAGAPHGIRPFGEQALMVLRIEAGLPLVDVEWRNSRLAETDAERVTPTELGLGWLLRGIDDDARPFIGRRAILRELADRTSRWATVGVAVDPADWDRLHREVGLLPPVLEHPPPYESMLYDGAPGAGGAECGYVTSLVWSPLLQRHVGIARVRPDLAAPGTEVHLERAVAHHNTSVLARTTRLPHVDLARRTA